MATLKKYDLRGEETGVVNVEGKFVDCFASSQSVKESILAIRENRRQWSASTKTRAEVKATGKKPWSQKGSGRARQGSLVSPQFRGGGVAFGPRPKFDQHRRVNRKERRQVIRYLLAEKIKENRVVVVDSFSMEAPKTKFVSAFIQKVTDGKRTLFVGEGIHAEESSESQVAVKSAPHKNFTRSLRNMQKMHFRLAKNVSGYDVMVSQNLVMSEAALQELLDWLNG